MLRYLYLNAPVTGCPKLFLNSLSLLNTKRWLRNTVENVIYTPLPLRNQCPTNDTWFIMKMNVFRKEKCQLERPATAASQLLRSLLKIISISLLFPEIQYFPCPRILALNSWSWQVDIKLSIRLDPEKWSRAQGESPAACPLQLLIWASILKSRRGRNTNSKQILTAY